MVEIAGHGSVPRGDVFSEHVAPVNRYQTNGFACPEQSGIQIGEEDTVWRAARAGLKPSPIPYHKASLKPSLKPSFSSLRKAG